MGNVDPLQSGAAEFLRARARRGGEYEVLARDAKLAATDRFVITTTGDDPYMFGNPTPRRWVARAARWPVLTTIANNSSWRTFEASTRGVYPQEKAVAGADMSLAPSLDCTVAEVCGAFARRGDDPQERPGALREAVMRRGGQQALLDVHTRPGVIEPKRHEA